MAEVNAPITDRPATKLSVRTSMVRAKRRRRLRTLKAFVGIGVLIVVAVVALVAGLRTVADVVSSNSTTRLERYVRGDSRVAYISRPGGFRAEFPTDPTVGSEPLHLYTGWIRAHRLLSPVPPNNDTVDVAWFDIVATGKVVDPPALLAALAPSLARNLEGDAPAQPHVVAGSHPPAYEFTVPAPAKANHGDYHVRVMLSGRRVYVLRVQARDDDARARSALAALAGSFQLLKRER